MKYCSYIHAGLLAAAAMLAVAGTTARGAPDIAPPAATYPMPPLAPATALPAWPEKPALGEGCVLRVVRRNVAEAGDLYPLRLLALVLQKTALTYGPCRLTYAEGASPRRNFQRVRSDKLDITWAVTTVERERLLRPVRIPVYKGLHGLRIMLIRKGEAARFAGIKTAADLRHFTAGQGSDWQPTDVWRANRLPVAASDNYLSLFRMLILKRFDYFPRAAFEPWQELAQRPELDLEVEPNLLIRFPAPAYFFVHPDRADLAKRLEEGLEEAIADGSRDELLRREPEYASMWEHIGRQPRRVIDLPNPLLPPLTPITRKELWFSAEDLAEFARP